MSGPDTHPAADEAPTARSWTDVVGSALCGLVLSAANLVTGYLVFLACLVEPGGSDWVAHYQFTSGFALIFSAGTALLTWVFVLAEWVRRWWYAVPVLLAVAALLRLTLLAPHL
jgi:hypothetical protein